MMIGMTEGVTTGRDHVRDQRIERVVPLVTPHALLTEMPLGPERAKAVVRDRERVSAVLDGDDDRLLVVVGPCSVHDPEAAIDYARRLAETAERCRDDLLIAMRVYFEKPRTTTGWKGLINDPHLDGSLDVNAGPAHGARAAARGASGSACPSASSSSTRSRRSTSPTPSPGARSARARPRARRTGSSARACRCRSASRTAPTATSRSRSTRSARRRSRTPSPGSTTPARRRSCTRPAIPTAT